MLNAKNVSKEKHSQYSSRNIFRNLNKIFLTGTVAKTVSKQKVITGNWGCGAYGNDLFLMFIIQILGFSQAESEFVYCPFSETKAFEHFKELAEILEGRSVSEVVRIVLGYGERRNPLKIKFSDYLFEKLNK